jgi:hypothetical protein
VQVFLATLATGVSVRRAAKLAGLSERRILRWVAFHEFLPAVEEAQRKAQIAKADHTGRTAFDADVDLAIAMQNRELQLAADRYAEGDRDRLHEMWMSGELMEIYDREAITDLRRHGKHDLADHYEQALRVAPPRPSFDYALEEFQRASFK